MANTEELSVERRSNSTKNVDDLMAMQNSDNPRMVLVTAFLTDSNFLTWSRSVRRALAAKNKLGFINGSITEQAEEPNRGKWKRVDEMVISWIINSMTKEIVETFVYCTLARRLRIELEEQFDEGNNPQIY